MTRPPSSPDIVERLRDRAKAAREENTGTALGDAVHFEEAADEIERSRCSAGSAIAALNEILRECDEAPTDNNAWVVAIQNIARAALQSPDAAQAGWMPIETKPKDHFAYLVWTEYGALVAFEDVNWQWFARGGDEPLDYLPTHWRHLPERPTPPLSSTDRGGA